MTAEGQNAKVTCKVKGEPRPEVSWLHNGKPIADFEHFTMNMKDGVCTLSLQDTTVEMSGEYTVKATNKHGTQLSKTDVEVKVKGGLDHRIIMVQTYQTRIDGSKI